MPKQDLLRRISARLARGDLFDGGFDLLLSARARSQSRLHWSPLWVARRAALSFAEHGSTRILDVGSGPGKFCIAAGAAQPELKFHGVEQRADLVDSATNLAERLNVRNVEFSAGDALKASWHKFDGFYFFNPFDEDPFSADCSDPSEDLSRPRFGATALRVAKLLAPLRRGAVVITYHGLGGLIPSSYELVRQEPIGSACLRTWVKTRSREAAWYYLDHADDVSRAPREDVDPPHGTAAT